MLKYLAYFWNCYQDAFKTLWVTGNEGAGKTYMLKRFASFIPDSFYYSFSNGIMDFKQIFHVDQEGNETWFEDVVEKLAEKHSLIIMDDFEPVHEAWKGRLWPIMGLQERLHKRNVLLVLVSREPMLMHPLFSMMVFGSKYNRRIRINQELISKPVIEEIYKSPREALLSYCISGYFPMGQYEFVYEDNHNHHDSILHLLENRDYRIRLLDEAKAGNRQFKKQQSKQYENFLNRFIRDFKQKDPRYLTQEELEEYYQQNIAPFLDEYAKSVCPPPLADMLKWVEKQSKNPRENKLSNACTPLL